MRLGWCTDPHLNFIEIGEIIEFGRKIAAEGVDALLVTGDIAQAESVEESLLLLHEGLEKPIFFVLGNHDFYNSSVAAVRNDMRELAHEGLKYLTFSEPIELGPDTALVGDDGWYDGRNGNLLTSNMVLADFEAIDDIRDILRDAPPNIGPIVMEHKLHELADEAVARVRPKLEAALEKYNKIIFATHVAPYAGAAWYKGRPSEDYAQPFFSSRCMGEMLTEMMKKYPSKKMMVLCGHSHGGGLYRPLPNVDVYTGEARYRHPKLNKIIDIGALTI